MRRRYIIIVIIIYLISLLSLGLMILDYKNYSDLLVTKRDFNITIEDISIGGNIEKTDEYEGKLWVNITMKFWNNGSKRISINRLRFELYLDRVEESHLLYTFEKGLEYELSKMKIKPGESIEHTFDLLAVDTDKKYGEINYNRLELIRENNIDTNGWSWIFDPMWATITFPDYPDLEAPYIYFRKNGYEEPVVE